MSKITELARLTTQIAQLQEMKSRVQDDMKDEIRHMSKEEKIKAALKRPSLTEGHMDLLGEGFMTGSKVYGDRDTAVDTDFCVAIHPRAFMGYAVGAEFHEYFESDGFQPLYANHNGDLINLICFSNEDQYNAWYQATQIMVHLRYREVKCSPFHGTPEHIQPFITAFDVKWSRVRMFRALVDILWPVKKLRQPLDYLEVIQYNQCQLCGREAINFMTQESKKLYKDTGICERCR